jgi:hypothetical protein
MNLVRRMNWRRKVLAIAVAALLTMAVIRALSDEPEIALVIGEPWEAMRLRSSAVIDPAFPGTPGSIHPSLTRAYVLSIINLGS